MKTAVITLALVAAAAAKFCPVEKNKNRCVAGDTAYKCAVFFGNLTESRPLTWIGALPDALSKASSPEEAKAILGADVTEESFEDLPNCDDVTANARCYAILDGQKDIKLDSCDRNLINTRGSQTIGNFLCGQVRRWLRRSASFKTSGIRDLRLPFYYSACNRDWTPITDGENDLYFDEALCCNPDGSYYNCDGSETNDQC